MGAVFGEAGERRKVPFAFSSRVMESFGQSAKGERRREDGGEKTGRANSCHDVIEEEEDRPPYAADYDEA